MTSPPAAGRAGPSAAVTADPHRQTSFPATPILLAWLATAAILSAGAGVLVLASDRFEYARPLLAIPSLELATGLVLCGLAYVALLPLIAASLRLPTKPRALLVSGLIVMGLAWRLAMLATTPALEDDFHRYLWDGAVTASGLNPYAHAPAEAGAHGTPARLLELAEAAGPVHGRINHPSLKTIYPPVAQAAFAAAYLASPFDLTAWRLVCVLGDVVTLTLLLAMLRHMGRSPLWVALYWWNPLLIKEMTNSAHMEAVLMPFVAAAVWLAMQARPRASAVALAFAAGTKLWPLLLAPILYRHLFGTPKVGAGVAAILAGSCAAWAAPILAGGLDASSGFIAYATYWQTNSALTPALVAAIKSLPELGADAPRTLARLALAAALVATIAALAWRPWRDAGDLARRMAFATTAIVLLSPAQFPWYLAWALPFAALHPLAAVLAASALAPLYYASFHTFTISSAPDVRYVIAVAIWVPVWAAFAWDVARARPLAGGEPR
ncbi:MAG: glycosyltransferase 87 family protein [Hyphomicrobiaceae bacterium]|nr:glycosyltransferase 87 family protein [Hyphomicrobiaceae bacterium]